MAFRRDADSVDRGTLHDSGTLLEQFELPGKLNLRYEKWLSAGS